MKEIALLLHEDVVLSTISGAMDMLIHINRYFKERGQAPPFRIVLVGRKPENNVLPIPSGLVSYATTSEIINPNLVIVPAFYGDRDASLEKHHALIEWLRKVYLNGAELASMCSGSYFLADTGLLSGRSCTSHWADIADLSNRYPDVNFLSQMVITDQEGIYTSGGAFSSLNLILYLIEKFCGREAGIWASKMFSLDIDRVNQAHFMVFKGQRQHEDPEILNAQAYIEQNYNSQISVDQVAEHTNMSKRNFIRRFKNATQNTPLEYMQRVKIESAKKALEGGAQNINLLMYDAGYSDVKTFRQVFKRITGLTPQDYRRKYCRGNPGTGLLN